VDRRYLVVGFFVLGLCTGLGYHYLSVKSPEIQYIQEKIEINVSPIEGKTITIGYISPTDQHLKTSLPFINQILIPDLRQYLDILGYDVDLEIDANSAEGRWTTHLEKVQELKSKDINLFIGGFWDYNVLTSIQYVNDNEMLMISPNSSSTDYLSPGDNLFRLINSNEMEGKMLAEVIWSYGIKAVIVYNDPTANLDNVFDEFESSYFELGGTVVQRYRVGGEFIPFSVQVMAYAEGVASEEFPNYLQNETGFVVLPLDYRYIALLEETRLQDLPFLYNVTWFVISGTNRTNVCKEVPEEALRFKLITPKRKDPKSERYHEMNNRYVELIGESMDYTTACTYDSAFLIVESVIQSQSLDASIVSQVFPFVAENFYGVSGWTRLNEAGDRYWADYELWSYKLDDGVCTPYVVGFYDSYEGITWYDG
jgi:branched-chain amino acid transport system substrate-binding protein